MVIFECTSDLKIKVDPYTFKFYVVNCFIRRFYQKFVHKSLPKANMNIHRFKKNATVWGDTILDRKKLQRQKRHIIISNGLGLVYTCTATGRGVMVA